MKKTYITPNTILLKLRSVSMICASYGVTSTEYSNNNALSRESNWDDDDEENY
jgi:hypothetical protein